jgi:hypothetical protein
MSARLEALAREKEGLLMRSALGRLRLRREAHMLRASLDWKRALAASVGAPRARQAAFGLALSLVGLGRTARVLLLATRVLFFAKLARFAIGFVHGPAKPAAVCGIEQTAS